MISRRGLLLTVCAATLLGGCADDPRRGYSTRPAFSTDVRTVSVPIFTNKTPQSGLESPLTEAIIKEIRRQTPWHVVQDATADTTLSGSLTGSDMTRISADHLTGLVQEVSVRLTVDFAWKDNRTGKILVSRRSFAASDTFVPQHTVAERIETGQEGATARLAKDIVAELRSGW